MFKPFHALGEEDAISFLPKCTSAVCCDMGVFIFQSSSSSQ